MELSEIGIIAFWFIMAFIGIIVTVFSSSYDDYPM
jgi:hypothetical protein